MSIHTNDLESRWENLELGRRERIGEHRVATADVR